MYIAVGATFETSLLIIASVAMRQVYSQGYIRSLALHVNFTLIYFVLGHVLYYAGGENCVLDFALTELSSPNGLLVLLLCYYTCDGPNVSVTRELKNQRPWLVGYIGAAVLQERAHFNIRIAGLSTLFVGIILKTVSLVRIYSILVTLEALDDKCWRWRNRLVSTIRWHLLYSLFDWRDNNKYCEYRYEPLSERQFRLLRIHRAVSLSRARMQLLPFSIDTPPDFEAISYVWGDPKFNHSIIVDNRIIKITKSAHGALADVLSLYKTRYVWIDSICINQTSLVEKGQQVGMMGEIYGKAARVIVWLGNPLESVGVLDHMNKLWSTLQYRGALSADQMDTFEETGEEAESWRVTELFFRNPWFTRIWIVQEAVVAKNLCILWGGMYVDWRLVTGLCRAYMGRETNRSSDVHIQGMSELYAISAVKANFDRGMRWSLARLLAWGHGFAATDARDKIFALHGLSCTELDKQLCPNYELTTAQVYREVTKRLIMDGELGTLLPRAGADGDENPSWVPDYRRRYESLSSIDHPFCAATHLAPSSPSFASNRLEITGLCVDTIESCSASFVNGSLHDTFEWIKSVERFFKEHERLKLGKSTLLEALCRTCIADLANTRPAPPATISEYQAIATDRIGVPSDVLGYIKSRLSSRGLNLDASEIVELLERNGQLPKDTRFTPSETSTIKEVLPKAIVDFAPQVTSRWMLTREFNFQITRTCAFRKICLTTKGCIALVPNTSVRGDKIFLIPGLQTPAVLQEVTDTTFYFVGECYVDGIMYGELANHSASNICIV